MGFFGMSESELKDFAKKLERLDLELKNRESDLFAQAEHVKHDRELMEQKMQLLMKEKEQNESSSADLERRRQEVIRLEMEAKAGFAKAQEIAFAGSIAKRIAELDARQQELEARSAKVAEEMSKAAVREGEIARRELAVLEREQKADAGFADKAMVLAAEAKRQHEGNLREAESLKQEALRLEQECRAIAEAKETIRQREQAVKMSEIARDAGYADERAAQDKKLAEEAISKREAMDREIVELRERMLQEAKAAATAEHDSIIALARDDAKLVSATVAEERASWEAERTQRESELKARSEAVEKTRGELSAKKCVLDGKESELRLSERQLEIAKEDLKEQIEGCVAEYKATLDAENDELKAQLQRLRESLQTQMSLLGAFDDLKRQLGDRDPAEVLKDLNLKVDEIRKLREELATRPTEEVRERYRAQETEIENLRSRIVQLQAQITENESLVAKTMELRRRNDELESENKIIAQKAERWEAAANEAQTELKRRLAAYERPAELEARYKEIELPRLGFEDFVHPAKSEEIDELTWLCEVGKSCDAYGLHFPERILKAYHTALKTSEWSPLTVLAGVSGTGKSELPRLYSHFGGLLFEPLSVQPNWDSPESMLGFFNSIDNKFDAQPVLRFLAQSQKPFSDEYPGLADCVCMILLDEMNLAHPELYFADFLSKLELRRGMKGEDVPVLPVKIGAGLKPYSLPLGRNVLWTGTMNQDETTKSLSDKVLDRSIVIHFPRPTELKRRKSLEPLDARNRRALISKKTYFSWWARKSGFSDEQIQPYKSFIEQINNALGVAGRAIGHRVWQSVEYYMANYPDVRAALKSGGDEGTLKRAMHIAFEDQLVQKVMPKLRGIDTRGKSRTECLDKIRGLLGSGVKGQEFQLDEDFNLALELGHGQFMWQSANYLQEKETASAFAEKSGTEESDSTEGEMPPEWFHSDDPRRFKMWNMRSAAAREKLVQNHENNQS